MVTLCGSSIIASEWKPYSSTVRWQKIVYQPMLGAKALVPHPAINLEGYTYKLYIAAFSMQGCAPCKIMEPRLNELRENGWKVYKFDVNIHSRAAQLLLDPADKSVPKLVVMNEGQPVITLAGTPTVDEVEEILSRIQSGEEDDSPVDDDDSGLENKVVDYDVF